MSQAPDFDDATRQRFQALHSALVADSLDRMGVPVQAMRHDVRPMYPGARIVGRALPLLQTAVYRPPDEPYEVLFEAFRAMRPNDVLVLRRRATTSPACGAVCSARRHRLGAPWVA